MAIPPAPYVVPDAVNTSVTPGVFETVITVSQQTVDIGGVLANCEVLDGTIPGPTIRLNVGDTLIVRLVNNLPHPSGIHWHGIELQNGADGTPMTQNEVRAGGTYLYKFKCPRPGLFWYHPHHHHSTNRVFRGTYGMIVVTDPNEATLIASGVLPNAANTRQLVLSDITVCKAPGANDDPTYPPTLPWLGPATAQPGPTPEALCEISPLTEEGTAAAPGFTFAAGDVPNIQRMDAGRTNEGQTVLTNGVNVGGRAGTPAAPGALAVGAHTLPVTPGQGLRLQIVNCATTRYFRLYMTLSNGDQVKLVRVGGEGGLLDNAIFEGNPTSPPPAGTFDWKYTEGEILLPPASRADVVVPIPATAPAGVATIWTQDFKRTGQSGPTVQNFANLPTVPVMHLDVSGAAGAYTIPAGTALRASIPGQAVEMLNPPFVSLLDPATFTPPKDGLSSTTIQMTQSTGELGIDSVPGHHEHPGAYTGMPKLASARYAREGDMLELRIANTTNAHHPFHLHGFSFQPISLTRPGNPTFTWPFREFRDNLDIPANHTLTLRVRIDPRPLDDGTTPGGALGRWLFHCHIFFHAHLGMTGELIITAPGGRERPYVDVGGSWAYAPAGGMASRRGTFFHPDGDPVTLTVIPALGTLTQTGTSSGTWNWELNTTGQPDGVQYVYIQAQDPGTRREQAVFRLKIGAPDDGADNGDPHLHTVDGRRYDFQAVGEFVLLRDDDGMELQARQTPVVTANPITDPYSGLTACVSVNTAVAARVGDHTIAYQPSGRGEGLELYVDGKRAQLGETGIQLGAHRVSALEVGGETGLRIDYAHHTVVMISPYFWSSHNLWLLNVEVANTGADRGIMGPMPEGSWLPRLSSGAALGPMPRSLHERYVQLYRIFADSWRVTDESSLFVYGPATSTETFTDRDWPAESPPCVLKPQFEIPGAPVPEGVSLEKAEEVCAAITDPGLRADCVFDVASTGEEVFAKAYLAAQELRDRATTVRVVGDCAVVRPLRGSRPIKGSVRFIVDGDPLDPAVELDEYGQACLPQGKGGKTIQAEYAPADGVDDHPSTSPVHEPGAEKPPDDHDHEHGHDHDHDGHGHHHSAHIKKAIWIGLLLLLLVVVLLLLLLLFG